MQKRKVEVIINGKTHGFMTLDNEARIVELAEYVNKKILEVSESPSGKLLPNDKKYVFMAMNMAEEYFDIRDKYNELLEKQNTQEVNVEIEKEISELKIENEQKLSMLKIENTELMEKINSLQYELNYVQELYKGQKADFERLKGEYEQIEQMLEAATAPTDRNKNNGA